MKNNHSVGESPRTELISLLNWNSEVNGVFGVSRSIPISDTLYSPQTGLSWPGHAPSTAIEGVSGDTYSQQKTEGQTLPLPPSAGTHSPQTGFHRACICTVIGVSGDTHSRRHKTHKRADSNLLLNTENLIRSFRDKTAGTFIWEVKG